MGNWAPSLLIVNIFEEDKDKFKKDQRNIPFKKVEILFWDISKNKSRH